MIDFLSDLLGDFIVGAILLSVLLFVAGFGILACTHYPVATATVLVCVLCVCIGRVVEHFNL